MQKQSENKESQSFEFKKLGGKIAIGPQIESGSYGRVHFGMNNNGQLKAIKVVNLNQVSDIIKSLNREDKAMRDIQSDYVIQTQQTHKDTRRRYKFIVMDLCNCFNLWKVIFYKGHLNEIEAKIYLKNIIAGLISMHSFGYMHRDIKSTNICFQNGRCVIIDLGCTRSIDKGNRSTINIDQSINGTIVGTNINKSPQMIRDKKYTYKTDFWGLGVLYYEMLIGVSPFDISDGDCDETALQKIEKNIKNIYECQYIKKRVNEQYSKISQNFKFRAGKFISPQAKAFLQKLITLKPEDRFTLKELEDNQYLQKEGNVVLNFWKATQCLLPLSDVDWKTFIANLREKRSQLKLKKQDTIKVGSIIEQNQIYNQNECVSDLTPQEKMVLSDKFKNKIGEDIAEFNKARYYHFQIRRINLLMGVRNQISQNQQEKYQKLKTRAMIKLSSYCMQQISKIMGYAKYKANLGIFTNKISGANKFFLSQYIANCFLEDFDKLTRLSGKVNLEELDESVYDKLREIKLDINEDATLFLKNSTKILQMEYKPSSNNLEWKTWSSFKNILNFIQDFEKFHAK